MTIQNPLPAPEYCDNCCSLNIELTKNDRIYGECFGKWHYIYFCNDCSSAVGCHPGSFFPLGRMADRKTRQLRSKAHKIFDELWQKGLMTRTKAYNWLASNLNIEDSQCHISWLTKDQLRAVATIAKAYIEENQTQLLKRKAKKHVRQQERTERESRTTKWRSSKRRS